MRPSCKARVRWHITPTLGVIGLLGATALGLVPVRVPAEDAATRIEIRDFMFAPDSATIKLGESVTWANQDDEPHTVVSDSGEFRSGALDTGEAFTFRFTRPGTYHFTCSIHPKMVGTIIVR
jgi:plastocyanin